MENNICRWFCGFDLSKKRPDHTLFTIARQRIRTSRLSKLFGIMKKKVI